MTRALPPAVIIGGETPGELELIAGTHWLLERAKGRVDEALQRKILTDTRYCARAVFRMRARRRLHDQRRPNVHGVAWTEYARSIGLACGPEVRPARPQPTDLPREGGAVVIAIDPADIARHALVGDLYTFAAWWITCPACIAARAGAR